MSGDTRVTPMYCPYCGGEDLRPHAESPAAWECHGCARVFTVRFTGLLASAVAR